MSVPVTLSRHHPVVGDVGALTIEQRRRRASTSVALVSMPFVAAGYPSIQLGLLRPLAVSHGFPTDAYHCYVDFAAMVGMDDYSKLSLARGQNLGEWLFSRAAFGERAPDADGSAYVERYRDDIHRLGLEPERLLEIRDEVIPAYLEGLIDEIPWERYRVVGFTSTFQQNVPSFALATMLKARRPEQVTIFGGANFEGAMGEEYVRTMACVDYAINGEADTAFPEFLIAVADGEDPASVAGVVCRRGDSVVAAPSPPPFDRLDELPLPDYDDYFARTTRFGLLPHDTGRRRVLIPFEASRGCWWGQLRHCTFCGLNGSTMAYRHKSPPRVLAELNAMSRRYRSFQFEAVDNIMERSYLDDLLPVLAADDRAYRLFFEVKANLTREQIRLMTESGVFRIQPGIESLSSRVLGLMRKGVRASQNVNLLRWSRFYGLDVAWNLLYGFPFEQPEDYASQASLIPSLVHLQPPHGASRIWLERFSPVFTDDESFPKSWRRAEESYRHVYPEDVDLDRAAYFFDYEFVNTNADSTYDELVDAVERWIKLDGREPRPSLEVWFAEDHLVIEDGRDHDDGVMTHMVDDPYAAIYRACMDRPVTAARVKEACSLPHDVADVERVLDEFVERRLMMRDGNLFLSLAIPVRHESRSN